MHVLKLRGLVLSFQSVSKGQHLKQIWHHQSFLNMLYLNSRNTWYCASIHITIADLKNALKKGWHKTHHFPSVQGLVDDMFEWITSFWQLIFYNFWDFSFSCSLMLLLNNYSMSSNTFITWKFHKLFLLSVFNSYGLRICKCSNQFRFTQDTDISSVFNSSKNSLFEFVFYFVPSLLQFFNYYFFCIFCLTMYFHGYIEPSRRLCTNVFCFLGGCILLMVY